MGRPSRQAQTEYMRTYRSRPLAGAVIAWRSRTEHAALRALARKYPAEYLRLLWEIRETDPKPETAAAREGQARAA